MDHGKQTSLTDALCSSILRQGDMPSPTEWERIRALAERVREEKQHYHHAAIIREAYLGMDTLDIAFLRATGRSL